MLKDSSVVSIGNTEFRYSNRSERQMAVNTDM